MHWLYSTIKRTDDSNCIILRLKSLVQYGLRRIKWIIFGAHLFLIISESALNFDQQLSCEQLNKLLEPKSSLNQNQILQNYNVKSKVFFFSFSIHFSLIFSKSKEWFCSWYIRFHNSWYNSLLSILIQVKIISMIKLTCLDTWRNTTLSYKILPNFKWFGFM